MDGTFLFVCLVSMFVCGFLGFGIGDNKGLAGLGAVLGAMLGPIGLLILAILPSEKKEIVEPFMPRATAYPVLEDDLPRARIAAPKIGKPRAPRFFICAVGGEVHGPYTSAEISTLREEGEVNDSTLFCLEGSENWTPAPRAAG